MATKKQFAGLRADLEKVMDKHMQEVGWYFPRCPKCEGPIPLSATFRAVLVCLNCGTNYKLQPETN